MGQEKIELLRMRQRMKRKLKKESCVGDEKNYNNFKRLQDDIHNKKFYFHEKYL